MESDNKNINLKDLIPKIEKIISNDKNIEDFKNSIEKLDFELPEVNEIIELAKSNKFHEIALKCKDDNYNFMVNFYKENGIIDSIIDKFPTICDKFNDRISFVKFLKLMIYFFKDSITQSKTKYFQEYRKTDEKYFVNKIKINENFKIYYISLGLSNCSTPIGFPKQLFSDQLYTERDTRIYIHKFSSYNNSSNGIIHHYEKRFLGDYSNKLNNHDEKLIINPKSRMLDREIFETIQYLIDLINKYSSIDVFSSNKLKDYNENIKFIVNNFVTSCAFYKNMPAKIEYENEIAKLRNENEKLRNEYEKLRTENYKLSISINELTKKENQLKFEIEKYSKERDELYQSWKSFQSYRDIQLNFGFSYNQYQEAKKLQEFYDRNHNFYSQFIYYESIVKNFEEVKNSMNLYFQNQYEKLKSAKDRIEKVAAEKINTYIEVLEKSMKEVENEKQINQEKFEEEKNKFIKIYEEKTSEYQNMIDHFDDYVTTELQKKLAEQIKLFKEFNEKDWDANIKYKFIEKVLNSATANKSSDLRVSDLEFKDLNEVLKCLQIFNMFELCANENNSQKIKRFTFEFLNKINEFISKMPNQK